MTAPQLDAQTFIASLQPDIARAQIGELMVVTMQVHGITVYGEPKTLYGSVDGTQYTLHKNGKTLELFLSETRFGPKKFGELRAFFAESVKPQEILTIDIGDGKSMSMSVAELMKATEHLTQETKSTRPAGRS